MSILTGPEIEKLMERGDLLIDPYPGTDKSPRKSRRPAVRSP